MKKYFSLLAACFALSACTTMKVVELDPSTGRFPATKKAEIALAKPVDLDRLKAMLLVAKSEFTQGQMKNIGYFDELITVEELETRIVQAGLTDKVPSVRDRIGINNAAKHYKPFLWFRFDTRGEGNNKNAQFILTDPLTLEDYFITETHLDYVWAGVNDQNNWYPMFNALIDYIQQNSKTYGK